MTKLDFGKSFKNKRVMVAGSTGMVGSQLVNLLLSLGAIVREVSLDDPKRANPETEFLQLDLTDFHNCERACKGMDYAFNLMCSKGSPAVTNKFPLKMFEPMSLYNANLLKAAYDCHLEGYLFTSTVGVYPPAETFREETALTAMPSPNDFFAGFAKMHAEVHVRAYIQQGVWTNISIVRPANIYGPRDNFDAQNAMVIPSLIKRATAGENPFVVWGDGTSIRDFIHAYDVARGILFAAEHGAGKSINLGSGLGVSIRDLVNIIVNNVIDKPKIIFDSSKPTGDAKRIMDTTLAKSLGFEPIIKIEDGIKQTMEWYAQNKDENALRYDIFKS